MSKAKQTTHLGTSIHTYAWKFNMHVYYYNLST